MVAAVAAAAVAAVAAAAAVCDGLTRADVLGSHLAQSKLSAFPNDDTMCTGMMLDGAEEGLVPQGLALSGSGSAWVTGYVPGEGCWVMRVDLGVGRLSSSGRSASGRRACPACTRAGGAVLNKHGLWVIDKHRLWLLDPKRVGKTGRGAGPLGPVPRARAAKRIKGAFLLDSGGRLGIGQHGKKADKILMFRITKLRKQASRDAGRPGCFEPGRGRGEGNADGAQAGAGSSEAAGRRPVRRRLERDVWPDGRQRHAAGRLRTGVEDFEVTASGRIWAVFQASAEKNVAKTGLVVPMLAEFDAARLFAAGADPATC